MSDWPAIPYLGPGARKRDPHTSHDNAKGTPQRDTHRGVILWILYHYPLGATHQELGYQFKYMTNHLNPMEEARKRCADLKNDGYVYATRDRRPSMMNKAMIVWTISQKGITLIERWIADDKQG